MPSKDHPEGEMNPPQDSEKRTKKSKMNIASEDVEEGHYQQKLEYPVIEDNNDNEQDDKDPLARKRTNFVICLIILILLGTAAGLAVVLTRMQNDKKNATAAPTTLAPTDAPSFNPTPMDPTDAPTAAPTGTPSAEPTGEPTTSPTPGPTGEPSASPTDSPTAAPTADVRTELLEALAANDVIVNTQDTASASFLAYDWMATEYGRTLQPVESSPKLAQRYALLAIDLILQGNPSSAVPDPLPVDDAVDDTTQSGTPPTFVQPGNPDNTGGVSDLPDQPFLDFDDGATAPTTGDTDGGFLDPFNRNRQLTNLVPNWGMMGQDECLWFGVTCNADGFVTRLGYGNLQLQGSIPTELGLLQALEYIDMSQNELQGTLPEELYFLPNLSELYLYKNDLTGTISRSAGNWNNLRYLHLSHNQLTGPIPEEMKSGSEIRTFYLINLSHNQLTGRLPSGLRWRQLFFLDLGYNQLSGQLPFDFGETAARLKHLHLDHNRFAGTFPSSYINVGNGRLEQLTINDNLLTGAVPDNHELFNKLVMFTMQNNRFDERFGRTCRLSVFVGGENVELQADCDICDCDDPVGCYNC